MERVLIIAEVWLFIVGVVVVSSALGMLSKVCNFRFRSLPSSPLLTLDFTPTRRPWTLPPLSIQVLAKKGKRKKPVQSWYKRRRIANRLGGWILPSS